jgi:hypothetical protein
MDCFANQFLHYGGDIREVTLDVASLFRSDQGLTQASQDRLRGGQPRTLRFNCVKEGPRICLVLLSQADGF